MSRSRVTAVAETVWGTIWGDLHEGDVPPELWAEAMAVPKRKNGAVDWRFAVTTRVHRQMTDIARKAWEAHIDASLPRKVRG